MIAKTFTDSFSEVQKLVDNFHKHIDEYLKPKYQEAEVRQDFLDKFFVALGWDVYHHENQNPYEREVRIEKSVMVQGRGKRADYAFYTAPNFTQARFMAEAKKPSKQLENAQDCFQAIRYGWNSNTPISVLTDFEQFLVLDSRYKPTIETALQRIIREKSYKYTDFADEEKFKEIYYLFSREAVLNDSLETFAKSLKGGRGARQSKLFNTSIIQPMDEEFLSELDEQRVVLAKGFKNRNSELDGETLTEITQRTLDRLVFLRFLEDKLVEPDSVIDNLGKKSGSAWRDFINEMPRLNKTYNGTLFKEHSLLDNPNFAPDERAFENTRDWLSHFNSPYDFNSIPIHILGSIYERFLGKTIVATDKRATVEDKPEVRKAGGVYYTPEYIVRYIVENTIGKLIEKKKPEDIAEMRFADIACGSGSFLLGVFDYLIAYHVEYFSENKTRREKAVKDGLCRETIEGTLQLTIQYKREILTNNIYGVDLDAQAVEVAQLSLYLKLLEEETTATKQQFLTGFREQLLPSLNKNIVHGNSLIDYDIMDGMLFDTRELKQLNPMNFQSTFPEVFRKDGFDAIVGNPPWGANFNETELEYLRNKNSEIIVRMIDSFMYFVYQGFDKLKKNGLFGMIIPDVILYQIDNQKLREFILDESLIKIILNTGDVFDKVIRPTAIIISEKEDLKSFPKSEIQIADFSNIKKEAKTNLIPSFTDYEKIPQKEVWEISGSLFVTSKPEKYLLLKKLSKNNTKPLIDFVDNDGIQRGVSPDLKKAFLIDEETIVSHNLEKEKIRKVLTGGKQVKRYFINYPDLNLIYTSNSDNFNLLPNICNFISQFKGEITCKEVIQKKHSMFSLHRARKESIFLKKEKILGVITEDEIIVSMDSAQTFATDGLYVFGVQNEINSKYLLAILNSKLFVFVYRLLASETGRTLAQVKPTILNQLPIRTIDFSKPKEKAAHDKMVELVEKMLEAKKSLANAQTDKDKTFFDRFCASLDRQIDDLVYDLYDLTAEEKKIIEGS